MQIFWLMTSIHHVKNSRCDSLVYKCQNLPGLHILEIFDKVKDHTKNRNILKGWDLIYYLNITVCQAILFAKEYVEKRNPPKELKKRWIFWVIVKYYTNNRTQLSDCLLSSCAIVLLLNNVKANKARMRRWHLM